MAYDADPAHLRVVDELREGCRFRFTVKNRDEGGGIEDHFGRPFLS